MGRCCASTSILGVCSRWCEPNPEKARVAVAPETPLCMRNVMMESCSAVMWCWVSSLMKMVTFLAGPLDSIWLPFLPPARRKQRTQPYAEIADEHAARHVQHTHPPCAVADRLVRLVLEARERGVSAGNPNHQEQPPVGVRIETLSKESHEDANQERPRHIDDECAQRKASGIFRHDPRSGHVAGQAAEPRACQDHQIFVQPCTSPMALSLVVCGEGWNCSKRLYPAEACPRSAM